MTNYSINRHNIKFKTPLEPGDSTKLNIDMDIITKGFTNRIPNMRLLNNGTFLTSSMLPSLGYNEGYELTNEKKRKKYDLPEKQLIAKMTDSTVSQNTYISNDGDWIRFETTVSTISAQTAIAPGYLIKEWEENGRRYLHYKMDSKILNFVAWLSADYEKYEDKWNDVDLAIYYHKGNVFIYALADYIGEDKLNTAIKKFAEKYAFQEPPFVTSLEFIKYIKDVTPDSLQNLIHVMFETITLYENKVTDVDYKELDNGKYKVYFSVECQKFRANSLGREKEIPINNYIDITVFSREVNDSTKNEQEIFCKKFKIDKKDNDFEFMLDYKPSKVGIDPYYKLIDRHKGDNTKNAAAM